MNARVTLRSAAAAIALTLAATGARANDFFPDTSLPTLPDTFKLEQTFSSNLSGGIGRVNVDLNGSNGVQTPSTNVLAGGFNVKYGTDKFIAWCLDILDRIDLASDYSVNNVNPFSGGTPANNGPVLTTGQKNDIQALFDTGYNTFLAAISGGANNSESAGFQLALWEIVNETADSYSLTGGNFTAANNDDARKAANKAANDYLAGLDSYDGTKRFNVSYLQAAVANEQNLVTVSPVPLPAAGILMLAALGGLAGARKLRRRVEA